MMSVRKGLKLLFIGIRGKKGHRSFIHALIAIGLILVILLLLVVAAIKGTIDVLSLGGSIVLILFILGNYQQDDKIDRLKNRIHQDEEKIDRLMSKEKSIDVDKMNQQMKEMQEE